MCWECWKRFPHDRPQRKPLVTDPGMHHGTCVTHVLWCILGSLTRGGGENVPGIPGACTTRNVTYLVKGPLMTDPCLEFCRCGKMNTWRGTQMRRTWETCVLNWVTSGPQISGVTRGKSTQWSHITGPLWGESAGGYANSHEYVTAWKHIAGLLWEESTNQWRVLLAKSQW